MYQVIEVPQVAFGVSRDRFSNFEHLFRTPESKSVGGVGELKRLINTRP